MNMLYSDFLSELFDIYQPGTPEHKAYYSTSKTNADKEREAMIRDIYSDMNDDEFEAMMTSCEEGWSKKS